MAPLGSFPFGRAPFGGLPAGSLSEPGYSLTIGARTDAIQYVLFNGFDKQEQANGRNTLTIHMASNDGFRPGRGEEVLFKYNETILFAGNVYRRESRFAGNHVANGYLLIDLECVDRNALADRRLIAEIYASVYLHEIYADIINNILAQEGVIAGTIATGPLVDKIVFSNVTVAQALDTLYNETGYFWEIDYTKAFNAGPRTVKTAPFTIDIGTNAYLLNYSDVDSLEQFRNVQVIEGGNGITVERTESFPGDGETRTWTVEYPLASKPALDIDGAEVSDSDIGIRGVDTGKRFYWSVGDNTIGQDKDDTVIPVNDSLNVTYEGLFKILSQAQDPSSIAERQAVEGGSGRYEQIANEGDLDGEEVVQQRAVGLLRRYALGSDVEFETDRDGLMVGQQVTLTIAPMGLSAATYFIMQMSTQGFAWGTRKYRVQATTGELRGNFAEFWKRVFKRNPIRNREQEILSQLDFFPETATLSELVTVTNPADVADVWGTAIIGETEWG